MQRIFVGDVQGCVDELDAILARAASEFGKDFEISLVGDLVNRGPDSLGVLRRVRELEEQGRAEFVLGNHELSLLESALCGRRLDAHDTFTDVLDSPELDDWVEWLRRRPLIRCGHLGERPFVLVHAAAHPDWDLDVLSARAERVQTQLGGPLEDARAFLASRESSEDRDLLGRLIRCRSVRALATDREWSAAPPPEGGRAWHEAWLERGHDYGVVYGHWSMQGLHVAPGLRGIDTGCVHHGRGGDRELTAWLPDPRAVEPFAVPDDRFWRIPAQRVYFETTSRH